MYIGYWTLNKYYYYYYYYYYLVFFVLDEPCGFEDIPTIDNKHIGINEYSYYKSIEN